MKITGSTVSTVTLGAAPAAVPAVPADAPAQASAALQSDVLKPAQEAMRALPDFDAARVAELRDALARGELPFDPARLAGLIQKFHGSR